MRLGVIIVMLLMSVMGNAQSMRSLFVAMPDSLCPLLTAVNRADFGDFLDSGMKAVVKNRFGKTSEMKVMTDDYIHLNMTSENDWEMKLLPVNDSTSVICVVKTFHTSAHDSSIAFFGTDWKKLNNEDFIELPAEDDFYRADLTAEQADSLSALRRSIGMTLVGYSLNPDDRSLVMRCTTAEYMGKDEKKSFPHFLGKDIVYQWSEGKFVRKGQGD